MNVNSDPEGTLSLLTETGLHSAYCAADREDLTGTVLGLVVDAPVVVRRQVPWFRRYRIPWRFAVAVRSCGTSTRSSLSEGGFCRILRHFSHSVPMDVSAHFSALNDVEFFVVEGSGWRGRRESDSQVFCHPN